MPEQRPDNAWAGMGLGWTITGHLVGGIAAVGGIGYLVDLLLGTENVFTAIGFVVGAAGGIYAVYLRYGKGDGENG
jgi:hypothetical protein